MIKFAINIFRKNLSARSMDGREPGCSVIRTIVQRRSLFLFLLIFVTISNSYAQNVFHSPKQILRQITTHPDVDLAPRLSPDGKWLAFVSKRSGNYDIWLKNLETGFSRQLTTHRADDFYPVWDKDQRYLIYVSQSSDAHGDLFRLNLRHVRGEFIAKGEPERLTFYLGFDGYPTISAFDEHIAWVSDRTGRPEIWLQTKKRLDVRQLTHGGATHPAWSPIQDYLAFTSFREDGSNGDIWLLNLYAPLELFNVTSPTDSLERPMWPITEGPVADGFPTWTDEAKKIIFVRHAFDTNGDGQLTPADKAKLWSVDVSHTPIDSMRISNPSFEMYRETFDERIAIAARPLTPLHYDARQPDYGADFKTYFISSLKGNSDIWSADTFQYSSLADSTHIFERINDAYPLPCFVHSQRLDSLFHIRLQGLSQDERKRTEERLALLHLIIDADSSDDNQKASALYEGGICTFLLGYPEQAQLYFECVGTMFPAARNQCAWAELFLTSMRQSNNKGSTITDDLIGAVATIQHKYPNLSLFQAQSTILLGMLWADKGIQEKAEEQFDRIANNFSQYPDVCAESQYQLGRLYERFGQPSRAIDAYIHIFQAYPRQDVLISAARDRLVAIALKDAKNDRERLKRYKTLHEQLGDFRSISAEPLFRAAALSARISDYETSFSIYDSIILDFSDSPDIVFAAKIQRAELLLRTGEFIQAATLLGKLTTDYTESYPELASEAKSRLLELLLESASDLKSLGNYTVAAIRYKRVVELDLANLVAHKGYIESMFYLGDIDRVVDEYEELNKTNPNNNILLYALGLAYSYRGTRIQDGVYLSSNVRSEDLERSNTILRKALSFDYTLIEAYLTLSYNYEMLENFQNWNKNKPKSFWSKTANAVSAPFVWLYHTVTFYNETKAPRYYESSIQVLTSALALNDEKKRPDLEALVALNMANNYYNLGEFGFEKAYEFYHMRMQYDSSFVDVRHEALIKERMGHCAMVVNDLDRGPDYLKRTIELYGELNNQDRVLVNIKRLALLYEFGEQSEQALLYYEQAATIEAQRNFYDGLLRSYRSLAYHHFLLNQQEEAVFYANKALDLLDDGLVERSEGKPIRPQFGILGLYFPIPYDLRKVGAKSVLQLSTDEEEAILYTILAETFRQDRQFEKAIAFYQKKLAIYEQRLDFDAQSVFQNNMAYLYFVSGDYDNAWKWFTNSYWMCVKTKNVGGQLLNITNAALVVLTIAEEPDVSKRVHLAKYHNWITAKIRELLDNAAETPLLYIQNRTHLYILLSDLVQVDAGDQTDDMSARLKTSFHTISQSVYADTLLSSAFLLAEQQDLTPELCSIFYKRGKLYEMLGEQNKALAAFIACQKIARQNKLSDMEWQALTAIGKIVAIAIDLPEQHHIEGDPLYYFQQAIHISESFRRTTPGVSATRHRQQVQEPYRAAIKWYVEHDSPLKALELAERMRERSYLDVLGEQSLELGGGRRQELYDEIDSLAHKIENLELLSLQSTQQSGRTSEMKEMQEQLSALKAEYSNALQNIRVEAPEIEPLIKITTVPIERLQSRLPDSLALLYQIVDEKNSWYWVMMKDTLAFFSTPFDKRVFGQILNDHQLDGNINFPDEFVSLFDTLCTLPMNKLVFIPEYEFMLFPWSSLVRAHMPQVPPISTVSSSLTAFAMGLANDRPRDNNIYIAQASNTQGKIDAAGYEILAPVPQQSGNALFAQRAAFAQSNIIHVDATIDLFDILPSFAKIVFDIPESQPAIIRVNDLYSLRGNGASHVTLVFPRDQLINFTPDVFVAWERALYFSDVSSFLIASHTTSELTNSFYDQFYQQVFLHPFDQALARVCSRHDLQDQTKNMCSHMQLYGFAGVDRRGRMDSPRVSAEHLASEAAAAFDNREWENALDAYLRIKRENRVSQNLQDLSLQMLASAVNGGYWDVAVEIQIELADQYKRLNEWASVADAYRRLAVLYEKVNDSKSAGHALLMYQRLVRQYGLDGNAAFAWSDVASILINGGNYRRSIDFLDRAAIEYEKQDDVVNQAKAIWEIANLFAVYIRDLDLALDYYDRATNLLPDGQYPNLHAAVLLDKSRAYYAFGIYPKASRIAVGALEIVSDDLGLANRGHLQLAKVAFAQGDIDGASVHLGEMVEPLATPVRIDGKLLQSRMLAEQNFFNEAEVLIKQAVDLSAKSRDTDRLAQARLQSAVTSWYQRKYGLALSSLEYALPSMNEHSRLYTSAQLILGALLLDVDEKDRAVQHVHVALDRSYQQHDAFIRAQCYLLLSRAANEEDESHAWLEKAISLSDSLQLSSVLWRAFWEQAHLALSQENRQGAVKSLQNGLRVLFNSRPVTELQQLSKGYSKTEDQFFAEYIELHSTANNHSAALYVLEKQHERSKIRLEHMGRNDIGHTALKHAILDSLTEREAFARARLIQEKSRPGIDINAVRFDSLRGVLQNLQAEIARARSDGEGTSIASFETFFSDAVEKLPYGTSILCTFYTSQNLYLWHIRGDSIVLHRRAFDPDKLDQHIGDLYQRLISHEPVAAPMQALNSDLCAPLDKTSDQALVIVPFGKLYYVPFSLLQDEGAAPLGLSKRLSYAVSPSQALRSAIRTGQLAVKSVATLVLPNNSEDASSLTQNTAASLSRYFENVTALTEGKITENEALSPGHHHDALYIGGSIEFNSRFPFDSRVNLSRNSNEQSFGTSVWRSQLSPLYVFTSGHVKDYSFLSGKECAGFYTDILEKNAQSLLSAQWQTDELAFAVLVKRFFRHLSEGRPRAEALRLAQRTVYENIDSHPSAWAAFRLFGDIY